MLPLVSIVIPVFNASKFISTTLNSVLGQEYTNWECLIIDDGSTDDSASIIKLIIKDDNRFKYFYQANQGLAGARNAGLAKVNGNFVQFLDADDVLLPSKIQRQIEYFNSQDISTENYLSYTDYTYGESDNIYSPIKQYMPVKFESGDYFGELVKRWESSLIIPCHCFLFSNSLFKKNQIWFDAGLPNHEDFDCWMRIFYLKPIVNFIDEKLCIYRISEGSMSKNEKLMGEGFVKVLNNHISSGRYKYPDLKLLLIKRRKTLGRYCRFDLMTFKEMVLSIDIIIPYYIKRIFQKLGLGPR